MIAEPGTKTPRKSERITIPIALVSLAVLVGFATYRISLLSTFSESIPVVVLDVDLERGLAWAPPETLKFPPRRLDLTCYLPAKSLSNEYQVQLHGTDGKHSIDAGRVIVKSTPFGRAVQIKLDLRYTPQGSYVIELIPREGKILSYPLRVLA